MATTRYFRDRGLTLRMVLVMVYLAVVFVAAVVSCHGSIKQMEKYFGVSYPTIKNRLNKIGSQLSFVEIEQGSEGDPPPQTRSEVLDRLSRGELTIAQALERLKER